MKIIVFDTETTGLLPKQHKHYPSKTYTLCPETVADFPHIVQLSVALYDHKKKRIESLVDSIIQIPEHIPIPEESIAFHGITREISTAKGIPIKDALHTFFQLIQTGVENGYKLVGHNLEFDIYTIEAELLRIIWSNNTKPKEDRITKEERSQLIHYFHLIRNYPAEHVVCTMAETTDMCKIPFPRGTGNKYPKLTELHQFMFGTIPNNLHNSLYDILITLRCFVKHFYHVDLMECCPEFQKHTMALYDFEYIQPQRRSERLKVKM